MFQIKDYLRRLGNVPYWLANRLPGDWILDRQDGFTKATRLSKPLRLVEFRSVPWLVLNGKSSDWANEMMNIIESPFFCNYAPQPGDKVVSVGAGIGTEAFWALKMVGPKGFVAAIEADPTAFSQLCLSAASQGMSNLFPLHVAAASKRGWVQLNLGLLDSQDFTVSTITARRDSHKQTINVIADTLGSIVRDTLGWTQIDLLLMNIEGGEVEALRGMDLLPKRLVVSCHDFLARPEMMTYQACREILQNLGYAISTFPAQESHPWVAYYIFAARNEC